MVLFDELLNALRVKAEVAGRSVFLK